MMEVVLMGLVIILHLWMKIHIKTYGQVQFRDLSKHDQAQHRRCQSAKENAAKICHDGFEIGMIGVLAQAGTS